MTKEEKIQQLITDLTTESVRWPRMKTVDVVNMLKIIQAIEPQSKWIKIESEDDLPKENGIYWVVKDDEIVCIEPKKPINFKKLWSDFKKDNITHYQPIQKPEPPIY